MERFTAAMKIRKVLKMSYVSFFAMGIKTMFMGEDSSTLWTQAKNAAGAVRSMKGIYEGDTVKGMLYAGQNVGGIKDIPTVQELLDRMVTEAEATIEKLQSRRIPA
jgi:NAD(P)H-dependent flavin oxidoreductase YrpB (nitropropane dioxygenase family)